MKSKNASILAHKWRFEELEEHQIDVNDSPVLFIKKNDIVQLITQWVEFLIREGNDQYKNNPDLETPPFEHELQDFLTKLFDITPVDRLLNPSYNPVGRLENWKRVDGENILPAGIIKKAPVLFKKIKK